MDLSLSDDEELLQSTVRSFVQREAPTETLTALLDADPDFKPEWLRLMADAGWLGAVVPADAGGADASTLEAAIICEELGRGPVPGPFLASSVVAALLLRAATNTPLRKELLTAIASGDAVVAPILPGLSSLSDGESGRIELASAGHGCTIEAKVPFVPYASTATHFLLPKPGASADESLELIVIPADAPGIAVRKLDGFLTGSYELTASDVAVEDGHVMATSGLQDLQKALARAYVLVSAYQVGGCQAVFDRSLEYSNTRFQFGVPIGSFQRVQDHIVELLNALDAARWTTYEAIWHLDGGRPADVRVHLAKAIASESYLTCTDFAHKVHGGIGVDPQYGLSLYTQMSRSLYSYLGHPRWHKRRMLGAIERSREKETAGREVAAVE
jgi:alkylation response protein AidB-like acyl-CoA dehydrogenase